MPRITVIVLSLMCCSAALLVADENPFSRWEHLKKKTDADTNAPLTTDISKRSQGSLQTHLPSQTQTPPAKRQMPQSGSFEYFAPQGQEPIVATTPPAGAPADAERSSQPMRRERLQADPAPTAASPQAKPTAASNSTGVNPAGGLQTDPAGTPIQQISGDFFESFPSEPGANPASNAAAATDSEANPFEEFLGAKSTRAATPAPQQASETDPFAAVGSDPPDFDVPAFDTTVSAASAPELTAPVIPEGLSGAQTPSVTLQWVHRGEFNLGQECKCELVLENVGRSVVRNVVAEAVLPIGLQVMKATPAPTTLGGSATWTFGELQPGQQRIVELVVVPSEQGDVQIGAFVRFTGGTTSSFSVKQPMLAINVEGPGTVEVGQQVNYTIEVSNPGTGKARNVVIQAAIPEGLEHRQGGILTIEIGTLNAGEQRRARLSLTGVKGGQHRLAVRTMGDNGMQEQDVQMVTVAEPNLNIGVRGPASLRAGQAADFDLIVVNEGRVDSSNVRAKYKVPEGYEFVKADLGGKFDSTDRTIDWFVGTLEPDQTRQLQVTLRALTAGQAQHQVGVVSEHGRVTTAEHRTTVQGSAELALKLVSSKPRAVSGDEVSYEVKISNVGQSAAENVGLSLEIPPGLELLDIAAPTEFIADNGVVIFRSLPKIEAGKNVVFTLQTRCKRAGTHDVRARVASESIEEALIGEGTTIGVDR